MFTNFMIILVSLATLFYVPMFVPSISVIINATYLSFLDPVDWAILIVIWMPEFNLFVQSMGKLYFLRLAYVIQASFAFGIHS